LEEAHSITLMDNNNNKPMATGRASLFKYADHPEVTCFSSKPAPYSRGEKSAGNVSINRGKHAYSYLEVFRRAGGTVATVVSHPHRTIQNMLAWLYARPALRSHNHAIEVREAGCSCMNHSGFWLYVSLIGRNPQANTDVDAFMEGKRDGFHGTSLQCLNRIVATGLTIGMAVNAPRGKAIQASVGCRSCECDARR
jgi:hypothetical protein